VTLEIGGIAARVWLERRCRAIPGVTAGFVCTGVAQEELKVAAGWPREQTPSPAALADARTALDGGVAVLRRLDPELLEGRATVPVPGSSPPAVLLLEVDGDAGLAMSALIQELTTESHPEPDLSELAAHGLDRLKSVLRWMALCLERADYRAAGVAVATELATSLRCERVSIGFFRSGAIQIEAMSNSAQFDQRTRLLRDVAAAMEEAAEQDAVVTIPDAPGSAASVSTAHEQLVAQHGGFAICTVPIVHGGSVVGAMLFERAGSEFDGDTVRWLEDAVALVGIALWAQRRAATGSLARVQERARTEFTRLLEPGREARKLAAVVLLAGVLGVAFLPVGYDVKADATLEGRVQRAIVAQVDGFVAEANARAGDVVRHGQTLATLDDRDFQVERSRSHARREELRVEYFQALSSHDKSRAHAAAAQIAQAEAQVRLVDEQLSRTRLVAPFDGVIVQGDLSQSLGSPVSRGDLLFEIAPLDGYRVILEIDEGDFREVVGRESGTLRLSALPRIAIPLTVERITPVATADEGRNYFRAEARLDHPPDALRPGMQGTARIAAEPRSLLWIWTHDIVDYLRLLIWAWL
jgi:RND family efflux transporter MFP subunit